MGERLRCKVAVYVRDTYRVDTRARSGFSLHYTRKQCSRAATGSEGRCTQHQSKQWMREVPDPAPFLKAATKKGSTDG